MCCCFSTNWVSVNWDQLSYVSVSFNVGWGRIEGGGRRRPAWTEAGIEVFMSSALDRALSGESSSGTNALLMGTIRSWQNLFLVIVRHKEHGWVSVLEIGCFPVWIRAVLELWKNDIAFPSLPLVSPHPKASVCAYFVSCFLSPIYVLMTNY